MEQLLVIASIILLTFVKSTRLHIWLIFLIFFCAIIHSGETAAMVGFHKPTDNYHANTEILIRFKEGASFDRRGALSTTLGFKATRYYERFGIQRCQLKDSAGKIPLKQVLARLREEPDVEWAEPNYSRYPQEYPDDPMFGSQWHLDNTGQSGGTPGADIQAVDAWDITTGDSDVVVAILDSGIDYTHPDLRDNMWQNPGEDWAEEGIPGHNGIDDDHNGYIDDYYGIDAANDSGNPIDMLGHGTHVAGIVGATGNNGVGITGVTWHVQLMALKFLDPYGSVADEIECISYILDQKEKGIPVRVVNASYGDSSSSLFEREAIESLMSAGIMMSASAGNDMSDLDGSNTSYPAVYTLENIISVAASDNSDQLAFFSNYGFHSVDVAAPGSNIFSTYRDGTYELHGGTSMAAPQVTGSLALIYSAFDATFLEAKERLFRGVDPLESLYGRVFTNGRLNVHRALTIRLEGPFIFSASPTNGSPGTQVTLAGVRFGSREVESRVTFDGVEANIIDWRDNRIECRVPEGNMDSEIKVYTEEGESNGVLFSISSSFQYFLPFAPAMDPWVSYLILTNFHNETVNLQVKASEAGAFVVESFPESLLPNQAVYRNVKEYGLEDIKNILWVESENDISVSLITSDSGGGMTFIRAQRR